MQIPIQRYFRVLVVGEEHAPVADIIEKELGFPAVTVGPDQAREAIHNGADLCAIVVGRDDASFVLAARHERGFEMPVFLVTERNTDVFHAPYLHEMRGVLIAGLESRDFYKKTFLTCVEEYVQGLLTPFFGKLLEYDYDGKADAPLARVVPGVAARYAKRYEGYSLRQLCDEMHGFFVAKDVKDLQRKSFRYESFPEQAMSARAAVQATVAGEVDYVPMAKVKGRIAGTLALIYPPGIGIVVPGERYDEKAQPMIDYFLAFEEGCNRFPGFSYEVQGVYQEPEGDGVRFYTYVVRELEGHAS